MYSIKKDKRGNDQFSFDEQEYNEVTENQGNKGNAEKYCQSSQQTISQNPKLTIGEVQSINLLKTKTIQKVNIKSLLAKNKSKSKERRNNPRKYINEVCLHLKKYPCQLFSFFIKIIKQNREKNFDFNKSSSQAIRIFIDLAIQNQQLMQKLKKLIHFMAEINYKPNGILYIFSSYVKIIDFINDLDDNYAHFYKEVVKADLMTIYTKISNHKIPKLQILLLILGLKNYQKAKLLKILVGLNYSSTIQLLIYLNKKKEEENNFCQYLNQMVYQKENIQNIIKGKQVEVRYQEVFEYIYKVLETGKRKQKLSNSFEKLVKYKTEIWTKYLNLTYQEKELNQK